MAQPKVALVVNRTLPPQMERAAHDAIVALEERGIQVDTSETLAGARDADLILVMGGDGTILRGAELGRSTDVPILGINYGHMGFLSEAQPDELPAVVERIAARDWVISERMTIDVHVQRPDGSCIVQWALNEVSVEKAFNSRLIETSIGVDGREISAFKADAVLLSTPTGSTAYNFSAGGPVVWPSVEALLLTPVAAHALFTRPLVVSPYSTLEVRVLRDEAMVSCDSRRRLVAPEGTVITAVRGERPVKLARLNETPFSGRLVARFHLPVRGWREREVRE
ncbi:MULTISPECIES: NAD kinase [Actinotignum]|uniref:NAD kinase n=2 Tax=Actinotignum timonense TaxID=1870995 RepID=A0AAW9HMB1_9ACTO|nr:MULTISPECIES: NAD kinase [Actinotignum]AIE82197.1 ATP-NAD kinase [Actinotignum schaalii]MBS5748603.1 NAD kinase [Actinotignum schaalii]MDE1536371.1 NAD kinase [Actinotignum schaalii]MDE1558404.1 NAD kinase [Actinotignum schaalii]MDE1662966.1 NAD kinase [Actinotignum schaalii]